MSQSSCEIPYISADPVIQSPLFGSDVRAAPIVQRRPTSHKQRLFVCCYTVALVISLSFNLCLTAFVSISVYEEFLNETTAITNIIFKNRDKYFKEKVLINEIDESLKPKCLDIDENSICFGNGNHENFDSTLHSEMKLWNCAQNRKDLKFLTMLMISERGRYTSYFTERKRRSFYFTKVYVNKLTYGNVRLPLTKSKGTGIRESKDALVIDKSGVFMFYLSLTLNLNLDNVHSNDTIITVIRENIEGRKTEILKRIISTDTTYYNAFENVFLSEAVRFTAKDRVYVMISHADVIWKYNQASWMGIMEI